MIFEIDNASTAVVTTVASGFCEIFKFQEAANFLEEMVLMGISPNRLAWC